MRVQWGAMSTPKAKRPATKSAPETASGAPGRSRGIQVKAYLSAEEKRNLDRVIAAWENAAAAQGFAGEGFSDWLRATIRREVAALDAAGGRRSSR